MKYFLLGLTSFVAVAAHGQNSTTNTNCMALGNGVNCQSQTTSTDGFREFGAGIGAAIARAHARHVEEQDEMADNFDSYFADLKANWKLVDSNVMDGDVLYSAIAIDSANVAVVNHVAQFWVTFSLRQLLQIGNKFTDRTFSLVKVNCSKPAVADKSMYTTLYDIMFLGKVPVSHGVGPDSRYMANVDVLAANYVCSRFDK